MRNILEIFYKLSQICRNSINKIMQHTVENMQKKLSPMSVVDRKKND